MTEEDPTFLSHGKCVGAHNEYYALRRAVYKALLDTTQQGARKFGILWESGLEEGPAVAILLGFVDTVFGIIEQPISNGLKAYEAHHHTLPYVVDIMRASLKLDGTPIAKGLLPTFDKVEAEFEKVEILHTNTWRKYRLSDWIERVAAAHEHCDALVVQHNYAIEVRMRQGGLLDGSCEICEP